MMIDFIEYMFNNLSSGDIVLLYVLLGLVNYLLMYVISEDDSMYSVEDKLKVLGVSLFPLVNVFLFVAVSVCIIYYHITLVLNKMNNTKLF